MKKFALILSILLLPILSLTACGGVIEEENDFDEIRKDDNPIELERHVNQDFLDDLDYLLDMLENNFALLDVAHWARSVDIRRIISNFRAEIEQRDEMEVHEFFFRLEEHFAPLTSTSFAHFSFMDAWLHNATINNQVWHSRFFSHSAQQRLMRPEVLALYEHIRQMGEEETYFNRASIFADVLDIWYERFLLNLELHGEHQLAQDISAARDEGNFEEVVRFVDIAFANMATTSNVITEVIEEGRIAYLSVGSFMNFPNNDERQMIQEFLMRFSILTTLL
ncbi:MAG: hypothetical protein FWE34_04860 [Defluviitaleaceae bacterium]|nr:hypothetical protein [Defluviitaleaceae bacterium]